MRFSSRSNFVIRTFYYPVRYDNEVFHPADIFQQFFDRTLFDDDDCCCSCSYSIIFAGAHNAAAAATSGSRPTVW